MKKNSITNKLTPCCNLPFGVFHWWLSNIELNTESDRQFIISKLSQNGHLQIDAWKVLLNSGKLESDAAMSREDFLKIFDCERQPSCPQFKLIIEGYKIGNYNPMDEYGVGWTEVNEYEEYNGKTIVKVTNYVGGLGVIPVELANRIGKYYAASGGFTTDKNLAANIKGSKGDPGSGIVVPTWTAQSYTGLIQVIKDYFIYELASDQTASSADVPGISNKWVKKIGGSAKQIFDKNNDIDPATMKATSDRYDKTLNGMKSFLPFHDDSRKKVDQTTAVNGTLYKDNGVAPTQFERTLKDVVVDKYDKLYFKGYPVTSNNTGLANLVATILGIKSNGVMEVLVPIKIPSAFTIEEYTLDVANYSKVSFCWANSGVAANYTPTIELYDSKYSHEDLKKKVDQSTTVNGTLYKDNGVEVTANERTLKNIAVDKYSRLFFKGYPVTSNNTGLANTVASVLGIKENGTMDVLLPIKIPVSVVLEEHYFDVRPYKMISICWTVSGVAANYTPTIELSYLPGTAVDVSDDSVMFYMKKNLQTAFEKLNNISSSIDLSRNRFNPSLEMALTENKVISLSNIGKFGNINSYRFKGGGVTFQGNIVMAKGSDTYDASRWNVIHFYNEYDVCKCIIENQ